MSRFMRAVAATCLVASAHAQTTWKVSCHGGPGIDFTDLSSAVAAASDGDTILVIVSTSCPNGPGPDLAIIDKALNIIGLRVFAVPPLPGSPPFRAVGRGVLEIANIPAGKRVVVSNINPVSDSAFSVPWGLRVHDCAGEIIIDGLLTGGTHVGNVLEITNCSNVTLNNSEFIIGPTPLVIVDSTVRMSWSAITGYYPPMQFGGYTETSPVIDLRSSTLTVTGGSLIEGSSEMQTSYGYWSAKPGIVHENSTLNIGPGVTITGGPSFGGGYALAYVPRFPGAIPSVARRDPRAYTYGGSPAATLVDMPVTYTQPVVANQDMGVVIAGPSNGFALLLFSDLPSTSTPTPFGSLSLDPLATTVVDLHFLPASTDGFTSKYYFVPSAALNGHAYAFQSLTLSPAGELGLTAATPFLVGWEHGRIP